VSAGDADATRLRDDSLDERSADDGPAIADRTAVGTGIGSLPGEDIVEAVRIVVGELPDFVHLPELPARGAPAGMIGRATAVLSGLAVDLQPAGWRLTDAPGVDQRRAASLLRQDLDALEEHTQTYSGRLKIQVTGPWTLAATMERPRGDRVLADHGARRDVAQSLAEGLTGQVAELRSRVAGAEPVVQLDEPALPAVLAGAVPTASGFGRHRSVDTPEAVEALRWCVDAIRSAGAIPVAHVCASDVPVRRLVESGFAAIAYDHALATPVDAWAAALDDGVDLWPGMVPSTDPTSTPSADQLATRVRRFFDDTGHDAEELAGRIVVTPSCGLAGASPSWAREAMRLVRTVAADLAP
jgi:methionine synthase II (cobalamin-independent)